MTLSTRIAEGNGGGLGLPGVVVKPALRASGSVVWAVERRGGERLVPYPPAASEIAPENRTNARKTQDKIGETV